MNCPNCQFALLSVKIPSLNPGMVVTVDQCYHCGGIWFDEYEMYQIPHEQAREIDELKGTLLTKPCPLHFQLNCPRDDIPLKPFSDVNFPNHVQIDQCPKCRGFWLNKGEFSKYKQEVKKKQDNAPKEEEPKKEDFNLPSVRDGLATRMAAAFMPPPYNLMYKPESRPFILSDSAVELLQKVPVEKKLEMYRLMENLHHEREDSENRAALAFRNVFILIRFILKILLKS